MRIIAFALRGCPAGWLGAYGNEWVATPHLDRLAAESVVFDRHISDCPDPDAARRAWFGEDGRLLTALRAQGIRTVIIRANRPEHDAPDWFYARWDERFDARPTEADNTPLDALMRALPPLLDRLDSSPDFLLWIDCDRLLPPWDVPQDVFEAYLTSEEEEDEAVPEEEEREDDEEEAGPGESEAEEPVTPWFDPPTGPFDASDPDAVEWLHDSFAAVVTTLDAELERLLQQLRERGLDRTAYWLVTADYGFPLGEHGQIGRHRPWLNEELVHVPLLVRLPEAAEACRRIPGFTQPADLSATIGDLFGIPAATVPGVTSLLPLARGLDESPRRSAITVLELGAAREASIRTEEWAYILPLLVPVNETREPKLFQKPEDRWEVNELSARNLERAEELERELRERLG